MAQMHVKLTVSKAMTGQLVEVCPEESKKLTAPWTH